MWCPSVSTFNLNAKYLRHFKQEKTKKARHIHNTLMIAWQGKPPTPLRPTRFGFDFHRWGTFAFAEDAEVESTVNKIGGNWKGLDFTANMPIVVPKINVARNVKTLKAMFSGYHPTPTIVCASTYGLLHLITRTDNRFWPHEAVCFSKPPEIRKKQCSWREIQGN